VSKKQDLRYGNALFWANIQTRKKKIQLQNQIFRFQIELLLHTSLTNGEVVMLQTSPPWETNIIDILFGQNPPFIIFNCGLSAYVITSLTF
jgi:hypothetical protein